MRDKCDRARLGEHIELISGQHIEAREVNDQGVGTPYLTGPADFYGSRIVVSKHVADPKVLCEAGDILLTVKGSGCGSMVRADGSYCISRQLMAVRARSVDPGFLVFALEDLMKVKSRDAVGPIPGLARDDILESEIAFPSLPVQRRIAEMLRTWDEAVDKTDRLIAAKSKAFGHWSLILLSGRKRLGSKRSNWQSVALTDVTSEATARNGGSLGEDVVMGVNKSLGMIPMKDHVRASDLSRYKIVAPDAFAYNPMRLNIGSIAQNLHGREVLVSPDYVAFAAQSDALLPAYFDHLRRSWLWSRFVKTAGSGGVRVRIYYDDLADFVFELPSVPEQRRIVDVLDTGRREIALLEAQRDALAKQKRGLMQKLLTGEWSVSVPDASAEAAA